jgi:DNA helicase-2/ATP-dependent DNA helicase PcrA
VGLLAGLNPEQRRAAEAVRGPVCILAGAGSGKTTTITHRIAHQVAAGAFRADEILAVTFTDKAARELRARLGNLGVEGVRAGTFHATALGLLRRFAPEPPGRILPSKAMLLRQIGNGLPAPYKFRAAVDLATEVEWAKNRRVAPHAYLDALGEHEPPIPPDLMVKVYARYEERKARDGLTDFEDLLEHAIRLLEDDEHALAEVRERRRAFTVDEYQDVNVLQQGLLDLMLGGGDELCAVGDDYQSIYAFTGASPHWLLALPQRFPHAMVVRLEANYRSTPEVLELANRLVPKLGGVEKHLRATRPSGPDPELRRCGDAADEAAFVVERIRALHSEGVPLEEMAILTRTNARSADFEEALHEARIPFQGSSLLDRDAARGLLKSLRRRAESTAVAADVRAAAVAQGWSEEPPEKLGDRELVRQADLARLVALAAQFDDGTRALEEFARNLEERFGRSAGTGVHLLTLHRAKGLEFDVVFLPRLEEKELPSRQAKSGEALAEERRLLYVGITRARRWLYLTWTRKGSRFLDELGVTRTAATARSDETEASPAFAALRTWRLERARADDVPAYVVFHNSTLAEIAGRRPRTLAELARVPGVGPAKLDRYGEDVLAALAGAAA